MAFHATTGGRIGAALLFLSALIASPTYADSFARVRVMSNDEIASATGRTITEWGDAWWKWAFKHPEILSDTTGEFAALGDVRGPVFFLEGSGADPFKGSVDVPRGEYVLLPVATFIWTFFDPCAEVRCARRLINDNFLKAIDLDDVFVWIDGKQVGNLASHVVRVDRFNPQVFLIDTGPIQEDGYGGILPALQGGYWVMLEPLPPGPHRVVFGATVPALDPFTGESTGETLQLFTDVTLRPVACRTHRYCSR
jgi:hypothetical protein